MQEVRIVKVPLTLGGPRGVNSYLVIGERPVLVDAGVPGMTGQVVDAMSAEGVEPADLAAILVTHAHVDHAGSLAELVRLSGAPVIAQAVDADALRRGSSEPVVGRTDQARAMVLGMPGGGAATFEPVEDVIIVEEGLSLADYGVPARVFHSPGHTAGGLTLVTDAGEVIVGDLIGGDPSGSGGAALPPFAVNDAELLASIRRVLELRPKRAYCGHAGPFDEAALEAFGESLDE